MITAMGVFDQYAFNGRDNGDGRRDDAVCKEGATPDHCKQECPFGPFPDQCEKGKYSTLPFIVGT
jgi:hypothetical protein